MKKLSETITKRSRLILLIMVLLCLGCALLIPKVEINADMTKYLSNKSSMKIGMDLMEEELDTSAEYQTIRFMFEGMTGEEKESMVSQLEEIPYVDSVDYEADSDDYNSGDYTLYVVHTGYEHGSTEEASIEKAVNSDFSDYSVNWKNDNVTTEGIPAWVIIVAMGILLIVLFIMSSSWLDPILFIVTIGIAIVINMGTNLIKGSISETTFTIAAILQLILSMDYAVILMNRYRQECEAGQEKKSALASAVQHAFSSVASSGLTTVVGLLMLVFMSYKIGLDLGIVLAKGVLISMICTFTVLPGLIVLFGNSLFKTHKKVPNIPFFHLAGGVFRIRNFLIPIFCVLLVGMGFLQSRTGVSYTLAAEDPIEDIFPEDNSIVMLYNNQDEDRIADLVSYFDRDEHIKSAVSFPTLLGKEYTAEELADQMTDLAGDMDLSADLLQILYYDYYAGDAIPDLTVSEFLNFLGDSVVENETFAPYLGEELTDNLDTMLKFSDPETLTTPMTAQELADLFGLDAEDLENLLLLHAILDESTETGTMTVPDFANFVVNELASDPTYGSMFDADTLEQMELLLTYTDAAEMTRARSWEDMADLLGIDASSMKLLYLYYFAQSGQADPGTMTIPEFVDLLCNQVAEDPAFSSYLDASEIAQLSAMQTYLDPALIQSQMSASRLANLFGMSSSDVESLLLYHAIVSGEEAQAAMTLPQFVEFILQDVASDPTYESMFDAETLSQLQQMQAYTDVQAVTAPLSASAMASALGMDSDSIQMLYGYYVMLEGETLPDLTLPDFLAFLSDTAASNTLFASQLDAASLAQLEGMQAYTDVSVLQTELDADSLAGFFGLDATMAQQVLGSCAVTAMTPYDFVNTLLSMPGLDESTQTQLTSVQSLMQLSLSGTAFSATEMAGLIGMDQSAVQLLYALEQAQQENLTISLQTMIHFLNGHSDTFASMLGNQLDSLQTAEAIIDCSVAGTTFSSSQLASLTGMSEEQSRQLFLLYESQTGTSWTMSPLELVNFIVQDLASDPTYSAMFDAATLQQLALMQTLMTAVVNGTQYSAQSLANLFGMDVSSLNLLFLYGQAEQHVSDWRLSVQETVNFLMDNAESFGSLLGDAQAELATAQFLINSSVAGTAFPYGELAERMGMEEDQCRQLYLLWISKHGDTSSWKLSVQQFVHFVQEDILTNAEYRDQIDADTADLLNTAQVLIDAVLTGESYSPEELAELLDGFSEDLNEAVLELLYLYAASTRLSDPQWGLSIYDMVQFLAQDVVQDPRFSQVLDEDTRTQLQDLQQELEDNIGQMKGEHYGILLFTTTFPDESEETTAFLDALTAYADANLTGDFYLIGNSPMIYEMENGFQSELLLITLLTAISIFIVVALTFRSLLIPLILVLIVQCGVWLTVSTCGLIGYNIYYLALLIVQCILMGATIDYGILYTNCYREARQSVTQKEAASAAYKRAGQTIMTSGLIMILVTGVIGFSPADATISQICLTIAIGTTAAILLIVLILPGLLMALDRFVVRKFKKKD